MLQQKQQFIIPAIDIINGECVRLSEGNYNTKKTYNSNPAEVAKMFDDKGYTRLHVVDLDGAKSRKVTNLKALEAIAKNTSAIIDFGGGVTTNNDINNVLNAGANLVNLGSIAVKQPEVLKQWIQEFGASKFLLGADVKDEMIAINGWTIITETSIYQFLQQYLELGIEQFFCTDIAKDGMLQGPSVDLYKQIIQKFPSIQLIASGGVSCENDLIELQQAGCKAAIVGKAIYEGKIDI
ncbi:MAG: 1-(5-phosphoribosyl)-5-[(5-phosphoribosylamino)methylideneamino]imidazole-4-carboxamide isomerase [Chitinophagaceae bacterium]